jgi:hypothetical protein
MMILVARHGAKKTETDDNALAQRRRAWPRKLPVRLRAGEVQRRLGQARERLGDRLLTWLTIVLVFLTFVIVPLHASGLIVMEGYGLAIVLVMASYFLGASASLWAVSAMLTGVGLAVVGYAVRLTGHPQFATYLDAAAWITVGTALAYVVARLARSSSI